ncbi:hypothetical protein CLAFUW4_09310 [Fulvia fulva]|uniref:Uncharacterized protein n=1 Tax=Passalora fulva TaxID=5499 RepID=A0A9Q8PGE3_PASFU|nr:uncharacterized protein CLAFUR5_09411 [Fulvia fulva]KAK4613290.1 hypothetical protein CLAFUR4_09316 [Fulvia fulva]KAK4614282.1 hypothetical protein CLAFUR0_09308 [Fulvia fulva]UJO21917.1 hypothetical protein CLAFUR5_09411 [Fulvia fulva]WPV20372.1 hypothetical protein CLAFUW4_09310 [Fulvia fulva]WPV35562.1 hypothetical protein CLAFUW7_09311 [Fulvia fulva]
MSSPRGYTSCTRHQPTDLNIMPLTWLPSTSYELVSIICSTTILYSIFNLQIAFTPFIRLIQIPLTRFDQEPLAFVKEVQNIVCRRILLLTFNAFWLGHHHGSIMTCLLFAFTVFTGLGADRNADVWKFEVARLKVVRMAAAMQAKH